MFCQGAERTADCCYMSHTTTHYFRPAKAWEREGVTPSHRGVKMSEQRDSSSGTRSVANASAFSRREKEHIARRRARSALCGEWRRKAQCVTRTRARESMSTPVSKTKHSAFAGCFCFNDDEHSFGASLSTTFLFRRRNYAPLSQAFTGGATAS